MQEGSNFSKIVYCNRVQNIISLESHRNVRLHISNASNKFESKPNCPQYPFWGYPRGEAPRLQYHLGGYRGGVPTSPISPWGISGRCPHVSNIPLGDIGEVSPRLQYPLGGYPWGGRSFSNIPLYTEGISLYILRGYPFIYWGDIQEWPGYQNLKTIKIWISRVRVLGVYI